jgi:hypothetical protein
MYEQSYTRSASLKPHYTPVLNHHHLFSSPTTCSQPPPPHRLVSKPLPPVFNPHHPHQLFSTPREYHGEGEPVGSSGGYGWRDVCREHVCSPPPTPSLSGGLYYLLCGCVSAFPIFKLSYVVKRCATFVCHIITVTRPW